MYLFLTCKIPKRLSTTITRNVKWKNLQFISSNRHMSGYNFIGDQNEPFLKLIEARRQQARRSILVQVQSSQSHKELYSYCNTIGKVKEMQHYTVEFMAEEDVENVICNSSHVENSQAVPIQSNFLWFRASTRKQSKLKTSEPTLTIENGTHILKDIEIRDKLKQCDNVNDQMMMLYNETKLNDTGIRLRYLTARQIETAVKGMFPHASAIPFGSSVNGYGKSGCDLDLVLRLSDKNVKDESRLVFHCKAPSGSERTTAQRNMELVGDLIQLFLPGCAQVRRILQAKVPIIKYYQQLTDVECDLSMSNLSGVHMSDFLYIMGSIDCRIRPLIFTIRKWAHDVSLTNSSPGRWITNFSLTLLVLAFLQKPINSLPILPSLNTLVKLAEPTDTFITEDGINCTFLRNINSLTHQNKNNESLESLLKEFFEFYAQFDFETKAVCLNDAIALTKPEHCPLYIVNPLERGLNVSKNVNLEELERFKVEARNAAWLLESQEKKDSGNWGLLALFENKRNKFNNLTFSHKQGRLMEVSTLFGEEEDEVTYKNDAIKKQVESIKSNTQKKLQELQQHKSSR